MVTDPYAGEKQAAAEAAAELVSNGMVVGLGTGSTVDCFLSVLASRRLRLRCVATSPRTELRARELGLDLEPFEEFDRLDIAVDGADQVDPACWLSKGGGGAHTREKIVAGAAERFVVVVSSNKTVEALHPPVAVEILAYGARATLRRIAPAEIRPVPPTPDGGLIADFLGEIGDPAQLAARLAATSGVVEHGLFPPELVTDVLVAHGEDVERRAPDL